MATAQPKKQAALDALLTSDTFSEAAEKAGCSRHTLYNYLHSDYDFAMAYNAARQQRTLEAVKNALQVKERVLAAVEDLMNDTEQPGAVRLKAASTLLDEVNAQLEAEGDVARTNVYDTKPHTMFDDWP